jgi:hypothetical protein
LEMNQDPKYWFCVHGNREVPLVPFNVKELEGAMGVVLSFECPECKRQVRFKITLASIEKIFGKNGKKQYIT